LGFDVKIYHSVKFPKLGWGEQTGLCSGSGLSASVPRRFFPIAHGIIGASSDEIILHPNPIKWKSFQRAQGNCLHFSLRKDLEAHTKDLDERENSTRILCHDHPEPGSREVPGGHIFFDY
jgi:hypothetical protein